MAYKLPVKVLMRLYQAVAIPRILYAADTPIRKLGGRKALASSVGHIKKIAQVQRQSVLIIAGAMRTSATDALEAHLQLLSMDLLVDKCCFRAEARRSALPSSHSLHAHIKSASSPVTSHKSQMHELLRTYAPHISEDTMEKVEVARHPPHWEPAHQVDIADSMNNAAASEERWAQREGLRVYLDGGGVGGSRSPLQREGLGMDVTGSVLGSGGATHILRG